MVVQKYVLIPFGRYACAIALRLQGIAVPSFAQFFLIDRLHFNSRFFNWYLT
jgi:hypothetical protein